MTLKLRPPDLQNLHGVETGRDDWRATGCVVLPGYISPDGYKRLASRGPDGKPFRIYAHRTVFEQMYGPIPDGMEIHHRCENKACCNALHLKMVTNAEHKALHDTGRCRHGHLFTPENTYIVPKTGARNCRTCRFEANLRHHERRRARA